MALVPKKKPPQKGPDEAALREDLKKHCLSGNVTDAIAVLDASPSQVNEALDSQGSTALHMCSLAGQLQVAQELIAAQAEVNVTDAAGRTPLHIAAAEGHSGMVQALLNASIDANAVDKTQQTALHKAAYHSNVEVAKALCEHPGIDIALKDGVSKSTPLSIAAEYGKIELVEYMLTVDATLGVAENDCGWSPLHLAAHGKEMKTSTSLKPAKYSNIAKLLLHAKAPVDAFDEDRKTPLHRAACAGNAGTVLVLIAAEANLNAQDSCRWTPLHYACQEGHLEVVKQLLAAKAKVQEEKPGCLVPLAVATMECHVHIAEVLLQYGADPNARAKGAASPAMIARQDETRFGELLSLFELGFISH